MVDPQQALLAEVEAFLKATGMSATKFSVAAVHDNKFIWRLRNGATMTTRTMNRARDFMARHQATEGTA